ncbi:hypothetical protein C5167_041566 [Papaver somniferum]|uniref:uncharacterized protein LOC113328280 n=1 Tax=Papaver somniferum TaxID=3469 RepID=UPI000E704FA0|nr:uncharacterized protein LOC113328280 [Papaver somniferum]RZC85383.1 hypothetical protein C5167_041566 [Papaver somniferum]
MPTNQKSNLKSSQLHTLNLPISDDDDDFENPSQLISLTQNLKSQKPKIVSQSKKTRKSKSSKLGKENIKVSTVAEKGFISEVRVSNFAELDGKSQIELTVDELKVNNTQIDCYFDAIESTRDRLVERGNGGGGEFERDGLIGRASGGGGEFVGDRLVGRGNGGGGGGGEFEGDSTQNDFSVEVIESTRDSLVERGSGGGEFEGDRLVGRANGGGGAAASADFEGHRFVGRGNGGAAEFEGDYSLEAIESTMENLVKRGNGGFHENDVSEMSDELEETQEECSLEVIESTLLENRSLDIDDNGGSSEFSGEQSEEDIKKKGFELDEKKGYLSNSVESRLLASKRMPGTSYSVRNEDHLDDISVTDFELGTELNVLMELCSDIGEELNAKGRELNGSDCGLVKCPLCGTDISDLNEEMRLVHSNECLDRDEMQGVVAPPSAETTPVLTRQVGDTSRVIQWLCGLGLSKYEDAFVKEEVDWETLHWLTEEDLFSIGVTALGPRKKIVHALNELRKENQHAGGRHAESSRHSVDDSKNLPGNKLITEFFPGSVAVDRRKSCPATSGLSMVERNNNSGRSVAARSSKDSGRKRVVSRDHGRNTKVRDIPSWCSVPGTPFRVDAFRYLRGDCTHWFLTHFHMDHYQGLTKSFCHGKIYCSSITARLVNMKIGVPWDRLEVLPLNQKISIGGVDVTCVDANHCPGSVIILFEPSNGKAVLHTGDFRFSEEMTNISVLQSCPISTLILDTTYCNPEYDFPKQEAVIQFVIDAIQAEAFNPKTLFLIGSYTIGKERLFLEVARCLRRKVYVGAAKLRILECLGLSKEDMQWFTVNEHESQIHVVPMWTIASFKRMKYISNQYSNLYNLIVAFSPTGWTFGKGKKKSTGRRFKQGTTIRYEVPYSEHSSFTELREFVKFISPQHIIPSVNNDGPESAESMNSLLIS